MSSQTSTNEHPWEFIATTRPLTNYATVGDIVARSDAVPDGFMGVLEDANVIFTTAGGGVRFQRRHRSGGFTIFTDNFTTTTTGINAICSSGDRIEIALSSTGVGVIDLILHGKIIRTRLAKELGLAQSPEQLFTEDGI